MQIVNLCSHPINIYDDFPQRGGSCVLTLPAIHPAEEARTVRQDRAEKIADHPAGFVLVYGGVQKTINVPAPREGVLYVVSAHVACHHPERLDLLVPGHTVKVGGVRVGCLGLSYFNDPRATNTEAWAEEMLELKAACQARAAEEADDTRAIRARGLLSGEERPNGATVIHPAFLEAHRRGEV